MGTFRSARMDIELAGRVRESGEASGGSWRSLLNFRIPLKAGKHLFEVAARRGASKGGFERLPCAAHVAHLNLGFREVLVAATGPGYVVDHLFEDRASFQPSA